MKYGEGEAYKGKVKEKEGNEKGEKRRKGRERV